MRETGVPDEDTDDNILHDGHVILYDLEVDLCWVAELPWMVRLWVELEAELKYVTTGDCFGTREQCAVEKAEGRGEGANMCAVSNKGTVGQNAFEF